MAHLGTQALRRGKQRPAHPGAGQGHSGPHPQYARPPERGQGQGDGDSLAEGLRVHTPQPLSLQRGPVWKILRRQRPPYPCTVQGRRPLLSPPLPPVLPQTGADWHRHPQTAQAQHPLLRHHRAAAPPLLQRHNSHQPHHLGNRICAGARFMRAEDIGSAGG